MPSHQGPASVLFTGCPPSNLIIIPTDSSAVRRRRRAIVSRRHFSHALRLPLLSCIIPIRFSAHLLSVCLFLSRTPSTSPPSAPFSASRPPSLPFPVASEETVKGLQKIVLATYDSRPRRYTALRFRILASSP